MNGWSRGRFCAAALGAGITFSVFGLLTSLAPDFLAGDFVVGAGSGLMFKGATATVAEISAPEHRAEALAGLFLAAYLGLAGPVIGLGALTEVASTRISLLVFAGLLGLGILAATPALLGRRGSHSSSQPQPTST